MGKMSWLRIIMIVLAFSAAGCDLMLGLDGKEDPIPLRDGDVTEGELDVEIDGELEIPPGCGDGSIDDGEQCDDGNDISGDGCEPDCTFTCHEFTNCADTEPCNGDEVCNLDTHVCEAGVPPQAGTLCLQDPRSICLDEACRPSVCGDGYVDAAAGEFCDPPGEDCTDHCTIVCASDADCLDDDQRCNGEEYCDLNELECSRRNVPDNGTPCDPMGDRICVDGECIDSVCGDGFVNPEAGEECDDGNTTAGDGCDGDCKLETSPHCGDGTQNCDEDEACDDGNTTAGDGCSPACRFEPLPPPSCGNAVVEGPLEKCDDGDADNGDACNPTCNFANTTTLFLGSPGMDGLMDGTGATARIGGPGGFALCGDYLYMADTLNNVIRRIDLSTASITTLAGDAVNGLAGFADSTSGLEARFDNPYSVATDGATLWVGDANNRRIRAIDLMFMGAPVTTVAGSGVQGHVDAVGTAARLDYIRGLTYYDGNVYFLEVNAATLRRFDTVSGAVITVAGSPYDTGGDDGTGTAARFVSPRNMVSDHNGMLYISDSDGAKIRVFNVVTAQVTTFAGNGIAEYADGSGADVRVQRPRGIACDGSSIYWAEYNAHTVRQGIIADGAVSTMVGAIAAAGYTEGIGILANFDTPFDIVFHFPTNSLFVLDSGNFVIRRIH